MNQTDRDEKSLVMRTELVKNQIHPNFIVSCGRSGSTLLRYIIDTHPDICSPGELELGQLSSRLTRLFSDLSLGQIAQTQSHKEKTRLIHAEVNSVISGWMSKYTESKGKRLWCEKSPGNIHFLSLLSNIFPDAKFICLYRNCLDVVHSLFEMARSGLGINHYYSNRNANEVSMYVDMWVDETSKVLAFEQNNVDRCLRVRYEDLVTDPVETLNRVFEFIGVAWDVGILDSVFSSHHDQGYGDIKAMFSTEIHTKSIGNGTSISVRAISGDLLTKMNTLYETLGYTQVKSDLDKGLVSHMTAFPGANGKTDHKVSKPNLRGLFQRRLKAKADSIQKISGVCKFVVHNNVTDVWTIDFNIPGGAIRAGDEEADCAITLAQADLINMFKGDVNPADAFMHGKLHISGDLQLARDVAKILFGV